MRKDTDPVAAATADIFRELAGLDEPSECCCVSPGHWAFTVKPDDGRPCQFMVPLPATVTIDGEDYPVTLSSETAGVITCTFGDRLIPIRFWGAVRSHIAQQCRLPVVFADPASAVSRS